MDANYYHYPGPWIGAKPGFMNGGGFPMRFADLDGTPIDVYQQNTNMTDESTTNYPAVDRHAARQRGRRRTATTASSARTCTPTTRHRTRAPRRSSLGAQARERPGDLVQAAARLGRRAQQLDDPRPRAGAPARSRSSRPSAPAPTACRRCCPLQGPTGTLTAITRAGAPSRTPCRRSRASSTRCSPPRPRRTSGHLRIGRTPTGRLGRPWPPVRCQRRRRSRQWSHGEGARRLLHGAEKGSVSGRCGSCRRSRLA